MATSGTRGVCSPSDGAGVPTCSKSSSLPGGGDSGVQSHPSEVGNADWSSSSSCPKAATAPMSRCRACG